ncbi:Two-component system histidine kinase DccS [hydrothermal vent metagenome]|uniref:histidine kinase n=1 Tax=hydrothermal vent metagenome TaxID=652676 RepID=A0A1W1EB94_9ZZZZ
MFRSEKRSLVRFLLIYLISTLLLFSVASWLFYISGKHQILDKQRESLKYEAEYIMSDLRMLHNSNDEVLRYPNSTQYQSAIYDLDKRYIFGSFEKVPSLENLDGKETLYHLVHVEPYFLGAAYLLMAQPVDQELIAKLQRNILLFMLIAGIIFSISGYYLGHLFVAPMRDSLKQMNRFIQDTTHELNTPISTILTNIEMIETFGKEEAKSTELKRIEIASKTLSRIYDDLTYLNLNHQYHREIVTLNMSRLIEERVVYFSAMAEAKQLKTVLEIAPEVLLQLDKNDAIRLIDNLISNAIKYNKTKGTLTVKLTQTVLSVKDTGIGIKKEDMTTIMQRFKRAENSEGGFGIGLDIVNQVVSAYGAKLEMKSEFGRGTEVRVTWEN